jgi:hypothetical protein
MCELLYILQGAGHVTIDHGPAVGMLPGDSLMAPAGSVQISADNSHVEDDRPQAVTFLRVMLPLRFVLRDRSAQEVADECSCAAQKVRARNALELHLSKLCAVILPSCCSFACTSSVESTLDMGPSFQTHIAYCLPPCR